MAEMTKAERMTGANLVRAEVHDSRLSQCRAEGVKLARPQIAGLTRSALERPSTSPF
jgi:hypothetical protein